MARLVVTIISIENCPHMLTICELNVLILTFIPEVYTLDEPLYKIPVFGLPMSYIVHTRGCDDQATCNAIYILYWL